MTILNRLISHASKYAREHDAIVKDFGVGATMIYVIVTANNQDSMGVTLLPHGEGALGKLQGSCIEEIFAHAKAYSPLQRAFALALVNALGQHALFGMPKGNDDIRTLLSQKVLEMSHEGEDVIFIGNLSPVVAKLKEYGRNPVVFCRQKEYYFQGVYSDIFEYEAIQKSNVAVTTGASLIGSTLDALLRLSPENTSRILAGFSAAAHPS